jgi:uncharacterized membrane protein
MSTTSSLSRAAAVPWPAAAVLGSVAAHKKRITSIDALRGFVMIVMMLDHVREHLYLHLNVTDPMTVPGTPADLYFSRLA